MMKYLYDFIDVERANKTRADKKVDSLIQLIFSSMEQILDIELYQYDSIQSLIEEKRSLNDEYSYFWDWMKETGLNKLKTVLNQSLPDHEEIHDSLDYREMILNLDIDNNIVHSYFASVADTIDVLYELTLGINEMCATEENEPDSSYDLSIEYHHSSESSQYNTQWVVSQNKSPAGNSGTFVVLYYKKGRQKKWIVNTYSKSIRWQRRKFKWLKLV